MITAQEARLVTSKEEVLNKHFKSVEELIVEAARNKKNSIKYKTYDDNLGDYTVLYNKGTESECLTSVGAEFIKYLRDLGYTVELVLYERQFVDMALQFNISW